MASRRTRGQDDRAAKERLTSENWRGANMTLLISPLASSAIIHASSCLRRR